MIWFLSHQVCLYCHLCTYCGLFLSKDLNPLFCLEIECTSIIDFFCNGQHSSEDYHVILVKSSAVATSR